MEVWMPLIKQSGGIDDVTRQLWTQDFIEKKEWTVSKYFALETLH